MYQRLEKQVIIVMKLFFTRQLLHWNETENTRQMPWKGEPDPYKIWLSEIILQQTRVEQGWAYYLRFIKEFPKITDLAAAPENKVYKLWEGLGYYSRCKNLIVTAKRVSAEYAGKFPKTYGEILSLKGIGPYTAAAIASFAFQLPYAVVDGNVLRVISRFFGLEEPIDSTAGKKMYSELAQELLDGQQPGLYNQAIMDFGAVVCKPQLPLCDTCILQKKCVAKQRGLTSLLPIKEKKITRKNRWLYYLVLRYKNKVFIRQRTAKDIWQQLYEFYLVEETRSTAPKKLLQRADISELFDRDKAQMVSVSREYVQKLTHQTLHGLFIEVVLSEKPRLKAGFKAVSDEQLDNFAFPKFIITYLKEKNVNLNQ